MTETLERDQHAVLAVVDAALLGFCSALEGNPWSLSDCSLGAGVRAWPPRGPSATRCCWCCCARSSEPVKFSV